MSVKEVQISKTLIRKIRTYFKDKPVLKAYLFGSYSRSDADESSDIDILVELDFHAQLDWNSSECNLIYRNY